MRYVLVAYECKWIWILHWVLALFLSHFLNMRIIQKILYVNPTLSSTKVFRLFPSFFYSTRMLVTFYRPTFQGNRCLHTVPPHCAASPYAHPGAPLAHSPYDMAGSADWNRPSGRWNAAGSISGHWWRQAGQRRAPTARGATMWGALRRAHVAPMQHREAWGWGNKTSSTGGGERTHASTGRTWWAARVWRWCQMGSQCEG